MEATSAITETHRVGGSSAPEARRASDLMETAIEVLREEVSSEGAMARAVDRLDRVRRSLEVNLPPTTRTTAIAAAHHALADVLAIGRAISGALSERGHQCLHTLAAAQAILYPLARAHGIGAPPPLTLNRAHQPTSAPPEASQRPRASERRASPRVDLEAQVSFESESNFYQGFSEDLSDGGLFIATYQLQPVGTKLDVEFTLPNGHIVRTRAEVRWLRDLREGSSEVSPGMGLRFESLYAEDERAIADFTQARAPLFYDEDVLG